jgi:hypothetical protein
MLWKLKFIINLEFRIRLQSFKWKIESKTFCGSDNSMIKDTSYPRDADLRNDSRRKGEREHMQNNIKATPEQLNLSKTYPSIWP